MEEVKFDFSKLTVKEARVLRKIIETAVSLFSDDKAKEAIKFFPTWKEDESYTLGYRVKIKNGEEWKLYKNTKLLNKGKNPLENNEFWSLVE